jgi:hypothetical protein
MFKDLWGNFQLAEKLLQIVKRSPRTDTNLHMSPHACTQLGRLTPTTKWHELLSYQSGAVPKVVLCQTDSLTPRGQDFAPLMKACHMCFGSAVVSAAWQALMVRQSMARAVAISGA